MKIKDLFRPEVENLRRGFTLVELLIVIALIGVLATALVATLNPIEQINKARDSRYKNDAAELLAAIERYYATQQFYPWSDAVWGDGVGAPVDSDLGLTGKMEGVGVCGGTTGYNNVSSGCDDTDGELISTDELKSSFAKKSQFADDVTDLDAVYLFRPASSSSVYVCFIPKASSNRKLSSNLQNLAVPDDGVPSQLVDATQSDLDSATWAYRENSLYICVPD